MMQSWTKGILFGFLVWLTPFIVSFLIYPLHESARPVFESIMSVAVTASAVVLGLIYLGRIHEHVVREGIVAGVMWMIIAILIDAPLMLLGGPMKMSLGTYMGDVGLTYFGIPIITTGLAMARSDPGVA